jgi:hypothetical protein
MNVRKVLAGGMAAIAAGATVAFGAFAQSSNLGDYVDNSGSTPVAPWIILGSGNGSPDYAKDVLGAADVAAGMAGFATVDRAVGGTTDVSVSGGVSLSTANTKIFGGDSINVAKDTLTSDDLPSILASGTFEDDDGNTYDYDQYIVVGSSAVALSNSGDDLDDPALLIQIGTAYGSPAYTMRVVFNDDLNFSNSDVDGNEIELFGTTYTVSSDSDTDTLVLFGGANKQTVSEGQTATVDVGGVSYEVTLLGVSDEDTAVVQVNEQSRSIDEGQSRKVGGLDVYVDEIYFLSKESQTSSAKLSFGSSKLTINDNDEVEVGDTDAEDIDNTHVTFTQGSDGTSVLEIAVAAQDDDEDHVSEDNPFTDPVFGTFKLAFGGGSPGLDERALIDVSTAGDDTATVEFTDYLGNSNTVEFAYDDSTSSTTNTLQNADGDDNDMILAEGAAVTEDQYFIINQDDFSHLMQLTDIDASAGDSDPTLTIKDVFSGTNYEISMTEGTTNYFNSTKVIDGKTYYFWSYDTGTDQMRVVWGTDSTAPAAAWAAANVGNTTSVFTPIVAEKGAEVAFLNNVSIGTGLNESNNIDILGIEDQLHDGTNTITGTNIQYTYSQSEGWIHLESVNVPGVVVLEEEGEDTNGNDLRNAVIVTVTDDSDGIKLDTGSSKPVFTDSAAVNDIDTSDNDIEVGSDRYGTFISEDTEDQGGVEIYYPDNQVIMAVGIGANPVFSVSGESGTVQEAYQLTSPVAKLASEISSPASLNRDSIIFGGPCANTLVATLMDVSSEWPDCFADFENLNEGMIAEYDDAFGSGQKALVIAGVTGDDTRALAAKVLQGTLDYSA